MKTEPSTAVRSSGLVLRRVVGYGLHAAEFALFIFAALVLAPFALAMLCIALPVAACEWVFSRAYAWCATCYRDVSEAKRGPTQNV